MRILITNDDGIHGPGLAALEKIAAALSDEVWVVAPETDQSGVSHSLTLSLPLRLREIEARRFAVQGTPTDCVLMGVHHVLKDKRPDLVLSGVNAGHNMAEDVIYSGTVAGAREGAILGIPAIALSQSFSPDVRDRVAMECAIAHGPDVIRKVLQAGIGRDGLVNINFPPRAPGDVAGVSVTRQGRRDMDLAGLEERRDGRNRPYFWIRYNRSRSVPPAGTDLDAVYNGRISVTPLRLDITDVAAIDTFARAFEVRA